MTASLSTFKTAGEQASIPPWLVRVCLVLAIANVTLCLSAYFSHWWVYDPNGLGIPTDFINVWAAGRLVLDGLPAQAYDWDIQKQVEVAKLGQDFVGYFAWHYPPPFLFVASLLAQLPYQVAYIGWVVVSFLPFLVAMRAIVGRDFGYLLALAIPMAFINALVGQNGFLTAALIGGTLYLIPIRPVLAGICLGLLTYKPQYGLLFPIALIAAGHWRVFVSAGVTAVVLAIASWLAFGIESWLAFFHWMPKFSQTFLTEGKAPWWKLQSIFSLVRYFGGSEPLGWAFQWVLTAVCGRCAGADVAKPRALHAEGRSARRRCAADHALSLHVRHDGAGDPDRFPGPHRIEDRLSRLRASGAGRRRRPHRLLHVHRHSDRPWRHAGRGRADPAPRRIVVAA